MLKDTDLTKTITKKHRSYWNTAKRHESYYDNAKKHRSY